MSSGCLIALARGRFILLPLLASCLFYTGCDIRLSDTETNPTPQSVTLIAGRSVTFTVANGFEGIHGPENVTVSRTADGLKIHALNGDPQIILPILEGVTPGNKLTVHTRLVSPDPTTFQLFYGTSAVSEFNEAHSVKKPIQRGDNDVVVEFTEPDFNGNIRLDPGMQAGDYILKLVEIRASPADTAAEANPTPMAVELIAGKSITFTSANGFEGIQEAINATMSRTADGLLIHALNGDPQVILPTLEGVMPGNKLTVHIQLISPDPTEFQIFYSTSAASVFDVAHSVKKPIQKGDNDVVVEFTEPDFKGKIRLDPGMQAGDYILKLVEVQSFPIAGQRR
jgi:hypothetical protein